MSNPQSTSSAEDVFTANPETMILLLTVLVWQAGGRATITQREMDMLAGRTIKVECLGCFDACQLSIVP